MPASATKKSGLQWEIFARLFAYYGPQGWWPVTAAPGKEPVYRPGIYAPQTELQCNETAFGAVLAQNTSWNNAKKATARLTQAGITTPEAVLKCSREHLAQLIRSSGYFRQKAKRLKVLSSCLASTDVTSKQTGVLREELLSLNGIGPETADSILLYAFCRPVFVVDAYTRRLLLRLGLFPRLPDYYEVKRYFEGSLVPSVPLFNEYHALIVRNTKDHCTVKSRCGGCPLLSLCRTGYKQG